MVAMKINEEVLQKLEAMQIKTEEQHGNQYGKD
jgi:hypothetical protein